MRSTSAALATIFLYAVTGAAQTRPPLQGVDIVSLRETVALTFSEDRAVSLTFRGTPRLPKAHGYATVVRKKGSTEIDMQVNNMKPASLFGGDFSTYVLWVVSPEGQVQNVGEFVLEADQSELHVSTNLSAFGMFVTAEPHYLVSLPSRFVVLEMTKNMAYKSEGYPVARVQYRGFEGLYNYERDTLTDAKEATGPVENDMKQALAAVQIAERANANEFARAELDKARASLQNTLALAEQRKTRPEVDTAARETVRQAVAAQKLAEERAFQAALESERRAQEQQLAELEQKYQQASSEAEEARLRAVEKARKDREESYKQMRESLSRVGETRESSRGLIVNIPDVLFDSDSATLRPEGRERLSRIAGIILATPGTWGLSIEGHTDSVGTDSYNQLLSEQRAESVRSYLVTAGVRRASTTARGFGESKPIASNDTGEGRQRNRRVEIIIEDRQKISSQE